MEEPKATTFKDAILEVLDFNIYFNEYFIFSKPHSKIFVIKYFKSVDSFIDITHHVLISSTLLV